MNYELSFTQEFANGKYLDTTRNEIDRVGKFIKTFRQEHFGNRSHIKKNYYMTSSGKVIKYLTVTKRHAAFGDAWNFYGRKSALRDYVARNGLTHVGDDGQTLVTLHIGSDSSNNFLVLSPNSLLPMCNKVLDDEKKDGYAMISAFIPEDYNKKIIFTTMAGYKDTVPEEQNTKISNKKGGTNDF